MVKLKYENIILLIITIITLICDLMHINLGIVIKLIIYLVVILSCKKENMLKYFIMFNCFSSNILLYIFNIIFGIIYLIRNKNEIILKNGKILIVIGFIEALHSVVLLFNNNLTFYILFQEILTLVTFVFFAFFTDDKTIKEKPNELINTYIKTIICVTIVLLIKRIDYYGINTMLKLSNGIGALTTDTIYSLYFNSNSVSANIALALTLRITIMLKNKEITLIYILEIISMIILGLLTFSLSFVVYVFFILLIIFIYELIAKKKIKILIVFFLILVVLLLIYTVLKDTTIFNSVQKIYQKSLMAKDVSNGRIDIYNYYIYVIKNNFTIFFVGSGLNTYNKINYLNSNSVVSNNAVTHNALLEIIMSWGIIGLILVGIYIYKILFKNEQGKTSNFYSYLPAICIQLYMLTGNFFIGYYSSLLKFILIYAVLFIKDKKL